MLYEICILHNTTNDRVVLKNVRTTKCLSVHEDGGFLDTFAEIVYPTNCTNKMSASHHQIQYNQAHETDFVIKDTAFSTVTINYNWRTALHKDAGDLKEGFGNLVVLEEGKYKGGCTGFPQFKVAIDVRNGDFLAMDVHEWHCNTEIKPITKDYTRLSLVAYLREKMINCKGKKVA